MKGSEVSTALQRSALYKQLMVDGAMRSAAQAFISQLANNNWQKAAADDLVSHWEKKLAAADACHEVFDEAQRAVRGLVSLGDNTDALTTAVEKRDIARSNVLTVLESALRLHKEHDAEGQLARLRDEEKAKYNKCGHLDRSTALGEELTGCVRLDWLRTTLLPPLEMWMGRVGEMQAERDELAERCVPSTEELTAAHTAFKKANRAAILLESECKLLEADGDDTTEKSAQLKLARREVQAAEQHLHRTRTSLAAVASAHYPELFASYELLNLKTATLAGADAEAIRSLLVERELSSYGMDRVLSAKRPGRKVYKASYALSETRLQDCVLKEFDLSTMDQAAAHAEWKAIVKEVKLEPC